MASKPSSFVNKTFRIQIFDENEKFLHCLPAFGQTHGLTEIPKNAVVKVVNFHFLFGSTWFEVEHDGHLYVVTESQLNQSFFKLNKRNF